jgi:hypothetical protein
VGVREIFSVAVLFVCDPCIEVKNPVWHEKKFLLCQLLIISHLAIFAAFADPCIIL